MIDPEGLGPLLGLLIGDTVKIRRNLNFRIVPMIRAFLGLTPKIIKWTVVVGVREGFECLHICVE